MSKGFIGLDNPSFQGNLRVYRRRETVRPRQQIVQTTGVFDDVREGQELSVQPSVIQPKASAQVSTESQTSTQKNKSPLYVPAQPIGSAGVGFGTAQNNTEPRQSRTERFEQWKNREADYRPVSTAAVEDPVVDSAPVEIVEYEQFVAEQQPAQPRERRSIKSRFGFLRKVPMFGKLTRKDLLTMRFALPAMAVAIFLIGCGIAIQGVITNRQVKAQVSELSTGVSGYDPTGKDEVPDETKPDEAAGPYVVAANMPRYIRINKIDVLSRIIRVGVKPNNELIAPNNIHTVGWYEGSALPGEDGTALMDAHVHGPTAPGAFYKIDQLNPGDEIEIEMGDGRRFNYTVAAKESQPYQNVDMSKAMRSIEDGKNGLNLITCGGRYNRDIHMYEERVVIYAVQK